LLMQQEPLGQQGLQEQQKLLSQMQLPRLLCLLPLWGESQLAVLGRVEPADASSFVEALPQPF